MFKRLSSMISSLLIVALIFFIGMEIPTIFNTNENKTLMTQTEEKALESIVQETFIVDKFNQLQSGIKSNKYQAYIEAAANTAIADGMTEYEKVKAIHDYIIINTSYDTSSELPDSSFSPEGVLLKGVAVCQGYAETFKLFMDYLGIDCQIIKGYADNVSHAWNIVKIGGEWYNIDVTWDDPIIENQVITGTDNLSYNYFLKPDDVFKKDHVATTNHPACTSTVYLYIQQYYDVPYAVLNSVYDIPDKFIEYYTNGSHSLTMYFPEDLDPAQTEILTDLYKKLYQVTGAVVTFKYYPAARYLDYSYVTVFVD